MHVIFHVPPSANGSHRPRKADCVAVADADTVKVVLRPEKKQCQKATKRGSEKTLQENNRGVITGAGSRRWSVIAAELAASRKSHFSKMPDNTRQAGQHLRVENNVAGRNQLRRQIPHFKPPGTNAAAPKHITGGEEEQEGYKDFCSKKVTPLGETTAQPTRSASRRELWRLLMFVV